MQEGFLFLELFSLETIGVCGGLPEMDSRPVPTGLKNDSGVVGGGSQRIKELKAEEEQRNRRDWWQVLMGKEGKSYYCSMLLCALLMSSFSSCDRKMAHVF